MLDTHYSSLIHIPRHSRPLNSSHISSYLPLPALSVLISANRRNVLSAKRMGLTVIGIQGAHTAAASSSSCFLRTFQEHIVHLLHYTVFTNIPLLYRIRMRFSGSLIAVLITFPLTPHSYIHANSRADIPLTPHSYIHANSRADIPLTPH